MNWLQIQLKTNSENAEILEQLLESIGALSVTMVDAANQPLFEPAPGETPLWSDILITGLFPEHSNTDKLIQQLRNAFLPKELSEILINTLPDQNWQSAWIKDFKPMQFGERLWICPSWCESPNPEAVNLLLDPGLAFGTGTHPTTALCLQWLDSHALEGELIIDYGCGSGVLGIAALLLGASKVYGVDNDPQAIIASIENCTKNSITSSQFLVDLPDDFLGNVNEGRVTKADGIVANILAEPLISLAEIFSDLLKPGAWLLLSGILEEQTDEVCSAYRPWFDIKNIEILEGWTRIEASRFR